MHLSEVAEEYRTGSAAGVFDSTVAHHDAALAIETPDAELTHAELQAAAGRFAGGLRERGFESDETVLLYAPNCPEYLITVIGTWRAGGSVSPVNPQYKTRELAYQLDDSGATVVVTHVGLEPVVEETLAASGVDPLVITIGGEAGRNDPGDRPGASGVAGSDEGESESIPFESVSGEPVTVGRADGDVALLSYTSGTTGRPKGVQLTHRNVRSQLLSYLAANDELGDEEVEALVYLPLYHITGFIHSALQPLVRGGTLHLRDPAAWNAERAMATIEETGITDFVGVTAMYVDMVTNEAFDSYDLRSLSSVSEGGAKMSVAVQEEFEAGAAAEISEGYGLTETTGATHTQQRSTFGFRHGTIGQPLRMVDARIVDNEGEDVAIGENGELLVRGPQVMRGYHDRPEATEAAFTETGYFETGDIARRDADNYYEIIDRKKHVIVTAGYNVYPSEVETVLDEHDAVAEAAVVGIPDERRNEIPVAYVVTRPGVEPGTTISEADVKTFCLETIAEYKHPRAVHFVTELPRTASGKVRKFELIEDHTAADGGRE